MTNSSAKSKLANNTLALLAAQVANQLLPLATIPYLTRVLGVEVYGVLAYGLALVAIGAVITDFGFNLSTTAEIARNRDDASKVNRMISSVLAAKGALFLAVALILLLHIGLRSDYTQWRHAFLLLLLPLAGSTLIPYWLFNGIERMAGFTFVILGTRILYVISALTIVTGPSDLDLLIAANGLTQLLAAGLAFAMAKRLGYRPVQVSMDECLKMCRNSLPFFWSRAAVSTYTAGGAVFLGFFSNPTQVGYYAAAEQVYKGAQGLIAPLGQALYPYMVRNRDFKLLFRLSAAVGLGALIAALISSQYASQIIRLLFGDMYLPATATLVVFLFTLVPSSPSLLLGYPLMGALSRLDLANRSVIIAGGLQFILLIGIYAIGSVNALSVAGIVLLVESLVLTLRGIWGIQHHRRNTSKQ